MLATDLEGRPWRLIDGPLTYRWGLNGRILAVSRGDTGRRSRRWLELDEATELWGKTRERLSPILDRVGPGGLPGLCYEGDDTAPSPADLIDALRNLAGWDGASLRSDAARFAEIYTPVGILPPDQYMSQVIQLTHGCTFNTCTFCTFYRDIPFTIKSPSDLHRHLEDVDRFLGRGSNLRHSLFLGDANALAIPMEKLEPLLEIVSGHYSDRLQNRVGEESGLNGMHAFLDGFSGGRKTIGEYRRMRRLGLERVTVGMESGHDPLLRWMRKPGTSADVQSCVESVKGAGLQVCLVVLIGAGGERFDSGHICDTHDLVAGMPLDSGDIVYFSEFVEQPGALYGAIMEDDEIVPLGREDVDKQRKEISSGLRPFTEGGPRTAVYDIREFIY